MDKADEDLIKRMLCREHAAMQTMLERYGDLIKSVVYRWLGALTDEREDCINEALFKIWQNIAQYDPEKCDLRCWIAAICRYEALDRRRKYAARPEIVSLESQLAQGVEPIASQVCEFSAETEEMLLMLPERDRALLIALYANGESVQELAKQQRISESGVYQRVHRAKKRLKKVFPKA